MNTNDKHLIGVLRSVATTGLMSASLLVLSAGAAAAGDSRYQTDEQRQTDTSMTNRDSRSELESQTQQNISNRRASTQDQPQAPGFDQVDTNRDNELVWTEIYAIYDDELGDAGWDEESVYDAFDENDDNAFDEQEYTVFLTGLAGVPNVQENIVSQNNPTRQQERSGAAEQARQQQAAGDQSNRQDMAEASPQTNRDQQANRNQQTRNDDGTGVSVVTVTTVTALPEASIEDREVINLNGESVGEVEEVLTDVDGTVSGVVVGVGGFWDIGDKDVKVDATELQVSGDYIVWDTRLDEDQLDDLPEYEGDEVSAAY